MLKRRRFEYSAAWYTSSYGTRWLPETNSVGDLRQLHTHHFKKTDPRNDPWFKGLELLGHSLEMGFNSGKSCHWLTRRYPAITIDLVDWNESLRKLVPWLREIVPAIREVYFGDMLTVPLESETYRNIFSFDFFEHVQSDAYYQILKRCRMALVPGGELFVFFGQSRQGPHINVKPLPKIRNDLEGCFDKVILRKGDHGTMFIARKA